MLMRIIDIILVPMSLCVYREELIAKLQFEIKCLNEQNKALIRQHNSSEETLREYQSKYKLLRGELDG